jgi:phosphoribosylamine--glycine ligase
MRIFVIGSGAREHALVWKLAQSPRVTKIFAAPGNPGMQAYAERVPLGVGQLEKLAAFAEEQAIDLTIVGPEAPLIDGIVDLFRERALPVYGPTRAGAELEGSKAFTKELMTTAGIPTAQHHTFSDYNLAKRYLEQHGAPIVVKADGNAAGKGAIVALDMETAQDAIRQMMVDRIFGTAGDVVILEDYLQGDEIGVTAICNGTDFLPLALSQDHKRALDGDGGLNTGGMGVYTPLPFIDEAQSELIYKEIIATTLYALKERNVHFTGTLYSNVMLTAQGPKVIEHNTRFGDPETQAFMPLLQADLLDVLNVSMGKAIDSSKLWHPGYAVSLTLASGGYPGAYQSGIPIKGCEEAARQEHIQIFHAGTATRDGQLVTAGGRVLSLVATGSSLIEAVDRVYDAAKYISFEGMHYRKDIAHRGLRTR